MEKELLLVEKARTTGSSGMPRCVRKKGPGRGHRGSYPSRLVEFPPRFHDGGRGASADVFTSKDISTSAEAVNPPSPTLVTMQAQYHHVPPPFQLTYHDLYHTPQPPYHQSQRDPNDYFSTAGLDLSGFSRGSSLPYPHQDYEHFAYRGRAPAVRLVEPLVSMPGATTISSCATGMGITGNHQQQQQHLLGRAVFQPQPPPEDIPDFLQEQPWEWSTLSEPLHGVSVAPVLPAPIPVPAHRNPPIHLSQHQQRGFFTDKSSSGGYVNDAPPIVLSPAAQLPTPASMAILLNPNSCSPNRRNNEPQMYHPLPVASERGTQNELPPPPPVTQPGVEGDTRLAQQETLPSGSAASESTTSREKKHACTMCHKRFDRPSTLRKHLLVHTGEKSFVCDTCGRRFGVASNRNRHLKACVRKCTNAAQAVGNQQLTGGTLAGPTPSTSLSTTSAPTSSSTSDTTRTAESPVQPTEAPPKVKRRRRAPSPSNWIPASLLSFNLSPPESKKPTPVPLPPVRRNLPFEERDSWDENVSMAPYHPQGWKNVLPGPGLGTGLGWKDLRNLKLEKNGEQMLGGVLVF